MGNEKLGEYITNSGVSHYLIAQMEDPEEEISTTSLVGMEALHLIWAAKSFVVLLDNSLREEFWRVVAEQIRILNRG